jgi:hypothetical protein
MKTIKQLIQDEQRRNAEARDRTLVEMGRYGYNAWTEARISPGVWIGTRPDGYKVAVDFNSAEWHWYRGRREPQREGRGLSELLNWLRKNS